MSTRKISFPAPIKYLSSVKHEPRVNKEKDMIEPEQLPTIQPLHDTKTEDIKVINFAYLFSFIHRNTKHKHIRKQGCSLFIG